jgi:hypothetical protein
VDNARSLEGLTHALRNGSRAELGHRGGKPVISERIPNVERERDGLVLSVTTTLATRSVSRSTTSA